MQTNPTVSSEGRTVEGNSLSALSVAQILSAFQSGQITTPRMVSDSAATVAGNLDALQTIAAAGKLATITLTDSGFPSLSVTAGQLTADALALGDLSGNFTLQIDGSAPAFSTQSIAGLNGHGNSVAFQNSASSYSITAAADGSGVNVIYLNAFLGFTDHLSGIQALKFSDYSLIIAQTPGSSTVTTGNVTELYGAVFGRLPDVPGLSFYQGQLQANPALPLTTFAQWFLASPEYTNNSAHNYAQTTAGDTQFITDCYNNLLHRGPEAGAAAWYETNVIAPFLVGLTPGTAAYAAAETLAHAYVLTDFSASQEFLNAVQVTATNQASAQHWLVLI